MSEDADKERLRLITEAMKEAYGPAVRSMMDAPEPPKRMTAESFGEYLRRYREWKERTSDLWEQGGELMRSIVRTEENE